MNKFYLVCSVILVNYKLSLGQQIIILTTERDNLQGKLNNLQTELGRMRWKFLNSWFRKSEKSKKITDLKTRIVGLSSKLFDKNQQITNLTTERNDLQNKINQLNAEKVNLTNEVNRLTTEKNNLQTNLTTSNQTNANLNAQIIQLTNQRDQLTTERDNLRTQVNNLTIQLNNRPNITQAQYNNLVQERDNLLGRPTLAQLQAKQNEVDQLTSQRNQLNATIANLNQQLVNSRNSTENEINRLNEKLAQAQSGYDTYCELYDSVNKQLSTAREKNSSLSGKIRNLKSEVSSLQEYKNKWNSLPPEVVIPHVLYVQSSTFLGRGPKSGYQSINFSSGREPTREDYDTYHGSNWYRVSYQHYKVRIIDYNYYNVSEPNTIEPY